MGSQAERTRIKATARGPGGWLSWKLAERAVPHSHADKPRGTTGERDRPHNPGSPRGEIKPQNLSL